VENPAAGAAAAAAATAPVAGQWPRRAAATLAAAQGQRWRQRHHPTPPGRGRWAATTRPGSYRIHGGIQAQTRREGRRHVGQPHVGSHVCGWCGNVKTNISHLRAHLQRPNCATAGASRGIGDEQVAHMRGRRHVYQGVPARLPVGSRNGPSMGVNTSDGRRPEPTTSAMPCGDGRPKGGRADYCNIAMLTSWRASSFR
jgi:hypothetical protein